MSCSDRGSCLLVTGGLVVTGDLVETGLVVTGCLVLTGIVISDRSCH